MVHFCFQRNVNKLRAYFYNSEGHLILYPVLELRNIMLILILDTG